MLAFVLVAFVHFEYRAKEFPSYFPQPKFEIPANAIEQQRAELGRMLFYDPILSRDSAISCASCHSPYHAFAHTDHALSHGIADSIGRRNAPALFNLAWQKHFMWDGAIGHLDMQAVTPITHPDEMGETMAGVIKKLQNSPIYQKALAVCWPGEKWESFHVLKSMSLFQAQLISSTSRYDAMRAGDVVFSEMEKKGYQVFIQHCNSCHQEPLFTTGELSNNGLPVDSALMDYGAFEIQKTETSKGLFKIPSLRNWTFTKPYMHDGRFKKMQEVIAHYRKGERNVFLSNTDMRSALNISDNESVELMAFLKTLNDSAFVFDEKNHFPKKFSF